MMIDLEDEPDQEKRIDKLRAELQQLGGEISHESDLPIDLTGFRDAPTRDAAIRPGQGPAEISF